MATYSIERDDLAYWIVEHGELGALYRLERYDSLQSALNRLQMLNEEAAEQHYATDSTESRRIPTTPADWLLRADEASPHFSQPRAV